jgi:hypothetical protein
MRRGPSAATPLIADDVNRLHRKLASFDGNFKGTQTLIRS